jgi:hypothetical protein
MLSALFRKKPGSTPSGPINRTYSHLRVTVHRSRVGFTFPVTLTFPQVLSLRLLRNNRGVGMPGHTNYTQPCQPCWGALPQVTTHHSPVTYLLPVLQWPASVPISSGESLHA